MLTQHGCQNRYLRNREAVLALWLVAAAAVTVFGTGRDAMRVNAAGGLSSLIGFSRAQSAEPLLLHAFMCAVRALYPPLLT